MTCPACHADAPCPDCIALRAKLLREYREAVDGCDHVPCVDGDRIVCGRCKLELPS